MGICVHGNANVRMAHQVPQCLWIYASAGCVAAAGMAANMRRDVWNLDPINFVVEMNHILKNKHALPQNSSIMRYNYAHGDNVMTWCRGK